MAYLGLSDKYLQHTLDISCTYAKHAHFAEAVDVCFFIRDFSVWVFLIL